MAHKLAAGMVVCRDGKVLLVKDKTGWSLPKGSAETGETFRDTAEREAAEETGLYVAAREVAFVTEFTSTKYGQYLQVYYEGTLITDEVKTEDPDADINEVKFVPVNELRSYLKFRAWVIPLENWMKDKVLRYYTFDLDAEGFEV